VICPKCGTANRPGAKYCGRCSAALATDPSSGLSSPVREPTDAHPDSQPLSGTLKLCPKCGSQNRFDARFCAGCAHEFNKGGAGGQASGASKRGPVAAAAFGPMLRLVQRMVAGRIDQSRAPASSRQATPSAASGGLHFPVSYAKAAIVIALALALAAAGVTAWLHSGKSGAPGSSQPPSAVHPQPGLSVTPPGVAKGVLPPSTPSGNAAASPTPGLPKPEQLTALDRALLATVQVIVPSDGSTASAGSGTVITDKGHILTNFHVIGDDATGRLYNSEGTILIAVNPPDLKGPPETLYYATLMQADTDHDLALLKLVSGTNGQPLPSDLKLIALPVGDSDKVEIGDTLSIIGFPGLGGDTVTLTKGSVSGFLESEGYFKTDAEINAGNSGGAAVNSEGQLVGIPSAAATAQDALPGKIGLVRPVNLARKLIDAAMADAQR